MNYNVPHQSSNIAVIAEHRKHREMIEAKPYVVDCQKGDLSNLEQRRRRMLWLKKFCGERGDRWDFFIRAEGGSTMCFTDHPDAVLFKLTWGGRRD